MKDRNLPHEMMKTNKRPLIESDIEETIKEFVADKQGANLIEENIKDFLENRFDLPYRLISGYYCHKNQFSIEGYAINIRIKIAEKLFIEGCKAEYISQKLSYSSVSAFCNQFKKITGFSPRNYLVNRANNPNPGNDNSGNKSTGSENPF